MSATCRGCGGNGVGQHVSPREAQVATVVFVAEAEVDPVLGRRLPRSLKLGDAYHQRRGSQVLINLPLADMLAKLKELDSLGFDVSGAPWSEELACEWCHGTGKPQLSVGAMEVGLR